MARGWKTVAALVAVLMMNSGCSVIVAANRSSYRGDIEVIKEGTTASNHCGTWSPDSFIRPRPGLR